MGPTIVEHPVVAAWSLGGIVHLFEKKFVKRRKFTCTLQRGLRSPISRRYNSLLVGVGLKVLHRKVEECIIIKHSAYVHDMPIHCSEYGSVVAESVL